MGVTSYFSEYGSQELVTVTAITDKNATCETQYGSILTIGWSSNLPDPAPRVGEVWLVRRLSAATWTFTSKATSGSYNAMRYAITLDARSCIGKERAVVDDIYKSGMDEVYLKVAADSLVMWNSQCAEKYGLVSYGDYISQLLKRLKSYNISVVLVIDSELWTNGANDPRHRNFQQIYFEEKSGGQYEQVFSNKFSPLAAKVALGELMVELRDKYQSYVRGICIDNFGLADEFADFSYENVSSYYAKFGEIPGHAIVTGDGLFGPSFWEKRVRWMNFIADSYAEFVAYLRDAVPGWPISVMVEESHIRNSDSSKRLGQIASGIPDNFSSLGWSSVGIPMSISRQSDLASELRSFEFIVAYGKRMAKYASPIYRLKLSSLDEYDAMLEIFAKYDATTILFDDYDNWKQMSDKDVIELSAAMGKYRVTEKSQLDYIGVLASSNSHAISEFDVSDNRAWWDSLENMSSVVLDKLPHRLKIFFDDDIEESENIREIAAIIIYMAENMSNSAIAELSKLISTEDRNIVFVGMAGRRDRDSVVIRDVIPFVDGFRQMVSGSDEFQISLLINGGDMDIAANLYMLDGSDEGYRTLKESGAESYIQVVEDGELRHKRAIAPIYIKDRSSMVGMDAIEENVLFEVVGELALYALGRD